MRSLSNIHAWKTVVVVVVRYDKLCTPHHIAAVPLYILAPTPARSWQPHTHTDTGLGRYAKNMRAREYGVSNCSRCICKKAPINFHIYKSEPEESTNLTGSHCKLYSPWYRVCVETMGGSLQSSILTPTLRQRHAHNSQKLPRWAHARRHSVCCCWSICESHPSAAAERRDYFLDVTTPHHPL